ncbi:dynein intermediate chain binding protein [Aureococcus anophagefferens]|nr:dynein intermediate chain binding protein [Aureococcus anophagefferens]
MSSEVEETLRRIQSHRGVKARDEGELRRPHAGETDELTFFRIRSKKHEIMIAPDAEYLLIVIQETAS